MNRGLLADRDELKALKGRVSRRPLDAIYRALRRRCALILETAPVTEPQWRALWQQGRWGSAIGAAKTTQGRILDLLIAHHIDPNTAYRDRAIEELDNLIRWRTWVDPCHRDLPADLCTAEAAVAAVVGLDWLWEDLDESLRQRVLQAVRDKAIRPYCQAVSDKAWWYTCYHSWNAVINGGCGLAGLAMADADGGAEATRAWQRALAGLKPFFDALGPDGGWDEGTGYWGYAMRYLLLFGQALCRVKDDQRIFHSRGMDATGLFPIYFTPGGRAASFGDSPVVPLYGALYLLTRHFDRPELLWWLDTYAFQHDAVTSGWAAAGLALLFRPDAGRAPEPKLQPVKVFPRVGWAALADRWPRPSFYAAVKTGDLSANHSQRDMNSLQLQVDGEMLLTDLGNAPLTPAYFSDVRGEFYEVQARAHNTITVAERDHNIDAQGQIVDSHRARGYRWVACDGKSACGQNVRFVRHLVMIVDRRTQAGRMLVVLDELVNGVPETVEMFWHTQGCLELNAQKMTGTIRGRRSALGFALASTVPAEASATEYPLDPHRTDHVLCVSAGVVGPALFASVFCRAKLPGRVSLRRRRNRGAALQIGRTTVLFTPADRRLKLASVKTK